MLHFPLMPQGCVVGILSDIHYAGAAEQLRGNDFETRIVRNPLVRLLLIFHRRFIWLNRPLDHNYLLDRFIEQATNFDYVVANGDYSCNTGFTGLSDPAARESAREALGKLRQAFGDRLRLTLGDHELGKKSFVGGHGGMRLASWQAVREALQIPGLWRLQIGLYVLIGVVSSLVALPVYEPDTLVEERPEWEKLRAHHMEQIRTEFGKIEPNQKILLFCHDPTALPFLAEVETVQARLGQIVQTIIGHLHSDLVLRTAGLLAGMPRLTFLGHTARRMSKALRRARQWQAFNVRLCPALAGIELLKDGGFLTAELDPDGKRPVKFQQHRIPR